MVRSVQIFLIPILYAVAVSCVRLAPQTTAELPAAVLDRATLCADVVRTDDWADLVRVGTTFGKSRDASVCSVLEFKPLSGGHGLMWKWYGPDGRLARTSDPTEVGKEGTEYDRYIAWDRLPLSATSAEGRWTVAFFIDGEITGSMDFEVKQESPDGAEFSPGSGF